MSPQRPSSQRTNAASDKPYSRSPTPPATSSKTQALHDTARPQMQAILARPHSQLTDAPGFPTREQYKHIEAAYLASLTPRRRSKAIITQALFDRIWDTLRQPDSVKENAQFRFWARKMFTLRTISLKADAADNAQGVPPGYDFGSDAARTEVLVHDGLLVAISEQIYDILCYCHGSTNHGGRDKTSKAIKEYYSWVPRELASQFIRACPTCMMRKCGGPDSALDVFAQVSLETTRNSITATALNDTLEPVDSLPALRDALLNLAQDQGDANSQGSFSYDSWRLPEDPLGRSNSGTPFVPPFEPRQNKDASNSLPTVINTSLNKVLPQPPSLRASQSAHGSSGSSQGHLRSLPMSREVSLYQGLPNGWQFHTDYATAHAAFLLSKNASFPSPALPGERGEQAKGPTTGRRPRIPSIAPIRGSGLVRGLGQQGLEQEQHSVDTSDDEDRLWNDTLPPSMIHPGPHTSTLPSPLKSLRVLGPSLRPMNLPQIDPMLLSISESPTIKTLSASAALVKEEDQETRVHASVFTVPRVPPSSSMRRVGAPPPLQFDLVGMKHEFERGCFDSLPPVSPPLSVVGSDSVGSTPSSELSAFPIPMSATSSAGTSAAGSSALPTPVDEDVGTVVKERYSAEHQLKPEDVAGQEESVLCPVE